MDSDGHHERISQDRVRRAPTPTQESILTPAAGHEAFATSERTETAVSTALRPSVFPQPHCDLSALLDSENTASISLIPSPVLDLRSLRVPTPSTVLSPGPAPRSMEGKKAIRGCPFLGQYI